MFKPQHGIGEHGERVPGPPWILGHRGSPREAPENTLISLRRAIDLGLDGVEYDVHAMAEGEPVLLHDETLDRTTDASGPVSELTLPRLASLDAGGWFDKRFAGEPLPLLEEALELPGNRAGTFPMHMIELKDPSLVGEVARQLEEPRRPLSIRIASFHRSVCREARDLGLPSMLLGYEANEDDRRFVRDERLDAYGTAPGGWWGPAGQGDWDCERWSWSVDEPDDLLEACRRPLFAFNTNEPLRAMAVRALVALSPDDDGPYPLRVPALEVCPATDRGQEGDWKGSWSVSVGVRNPLPFPVRAALGFVLRGGAFRLAGLPFEAPLEPRESVQVPVRVEGGSFSPGEDPGLFLRLVWRPGPGRPEESLILDAPLARVRRVVLGRQALRLALLHERPGDPAASVTVRLRGREVLASVENPGGLSDVRCLLRLGHRVRSGSRGVRLALPPRTEREQDRELAFNVGFEGRDRDGRVVLRRFGGGLPYGLGAGAPARATLEADA